MQVGFHKDKARILIFNILLTILSIILLLGIFVKEKAYKKNERFGFSSKVILSDSLTGLWLYDCNLISNSKKINIVNRENWKKIFVNGATSYGYNYSDSEENTIIPDSISFSWFSFKDEKFYHLNDALPNKKIIEWLTQNKINKVVFNFTFNVDGNILIYLNDYFNESKRLYFKATFNANEISNQRWNDRTNREEDIALINFNRITPCYIHLQNQHPFKYIKLETELKLNTLRNYFTEPDSHGKMKFNSVLNHGIPESIRIEIKDSINDKSKSFFIDFNIQKNEIVNIIKSYPNSEFEFHVKMNHLDSIQGIYLKDLKQIIPLTKPKINYRLQEYITN